MSTPELVPATQPGSAEPSPTGSPLPCPLNDIPEQLHQYIHALESRIITLETKSTRFEGALVAAGKFIFDSPQGKMIMIAFPKEAQDKLRSFFENKNGTT